MFLDPPAAGAVGKVVEDLGGAWKVPLPLLRATQTPASPKPTLSARPSPSGRRGSAGAVSTRHPPAL